ncbi:hypothetical protein AAZX31_13G197600 [Glycine max]
MLHALFKPKFYSKCKSLLKLTNPRKGARCGDFSRKTWPTFFGVPLITMHMEGEMDLLLVPYSLGGS